MSKQEFPAPLSAAIGSFDDHRLALRSLFIEQAIPPLPFDDRAGNLLLSTAQNSALALGIIARVADEIIGRTAGGELVITKWLRDEEERCTALNALLYHGHFGRLSRRGAEISIKQAYTLADDSSDIVYAVGAKYLGALNWHTQEYARAQTTPNAWDLLFVRR